MELVAIALITSGVFVAYSSATYRNPVQLLRDLVADPARFRDTLTTPGTWGRVGDIPTTPTGGAVPAPGGGLTSPTTTALSWSPRHALRWDAAKAAEGMNAAYAASFGRDLTINSSLRTRAQQEALYKEKGPKLAARPGTSKHELGLALDIGGTVGGTSSTYRWLKANAPKFGFRQTLAYEPWHWEFV